MKKKRMVKRVIKRAESLFDSLTALDMENREEHHAIQILSKNILMQAFRRGIQILRSEVGSPTNADDLVQVGDGRFSGGSNTSKEILDGVVDFLSAIEMCINTIELSRAELEDIRTLLDLCLKVTSVSERPKIPMENRDGMEENVRRVLMSVVSPNRQSHLATDWVTNSFIRFSALVF
jgi:hypothetical protein